MKKVIVITGPTAVGKTDISIKLAAHYKSEIINADASQFRKGLDIGTAKIDISATAVKHHLIDILNPEDIFSIKDYQILARRKIEELSSSGMIPFLVGGSGLYINAVLGDYELENEGRNSRFQAQYDNYSNDELHHYLESLDPESAAKIHPNNRRRVLRALEASFFGTKISEKRSGINLIYDALIICLVCERSLLYERINKRVLIMIENGFIEEVKSLKNQGIDLDHVKDIGYQEINQYLENKLSLTQAIALIQQKTRNYAKRQLTWFKNKMNCIFLEIDYQNEEQTIKQSLELIDHFIEKKA